MEATTPPLVPEMSLPQRVWGVLVAPRAVFEYLKIKPSFLGVLLITILLVVISIVPTLDILVQAEMEKAADRDLTADQLAVQEKVTRVVLPVVAVVLLVTVVFAGAGVLLFLSNVILGGQASYRQFLALMGHVHMVLIPAVLIKVPLTLMSGKQALTGPAALLPSDAEGGFLFQLFSWMDVFNLWIVGLTGVGLAVLAGTSTQRGVTAFGITWGIIVLAISGLGAVATKLGGGG